MTEQEIQNEIDEKANTEQGAEVIRKLGQQGIKVENPYKNVDLSDAEPPSDPEVIANDRANGY